MLGGCNVVEDLEVILMEVDSGVPELCCADTLIRIDENVQVLSCAHCVFKDTDKFVNFLGCPFNWGCTFGSHKSMVK